MPPKGAPTAYFLFTEANRAAIQKELNEAAAAAAATAATAAADAAEEGGAAEGDAAAAAPAATATKPKSVSVAVVAKEIGARWRALPEEEKERYKELARQRAEELAAAAAAAAAEAGDGAAADGGDDDDADAADQAAAGPRGPLLPRGVVKRVMACDPDFKRASADAVWLVTAAAEALLASLGERAARQALSKRRKTVKLEDLLHVVKYDRRLVEAGLRDVLEDGAMFEAAAAAAAAKAAAKKPAAEEAAAGDGGDDGSGSPDAQQRQQAPQRGRSKKAPQEDKRQRTLSSFFAPAS